MEQELFKTQRQRDTAPDKVTQQRRQIYNRETALEEEKGKNLKLRAQLNRNYENSSIPSSKTIHHKKISKRSDIMEKIKLSVDGCEFCSKPTTEDVRRISTRIANRIREADLSKSEMRELALSIGRDGYTFCPAAFKDSSISSIPQIIF